MGTTCLVSFVLSWQFRSRLGNRTSENERSGDPQDDCVICLNSVSTSEGVRCDGHGHLTCHSCLPRWIDSFLSSEVAQREATQARVPCPKAPTECDRVLEDSVLARLLTKEQFDAYLQARVQMGERRAAAEVNQLFEQAVQQGVARIVGLDERQRRIRAVCTHIVDEHLTTKCPHVDCRQAYVDFDGCAALCCSRCSRHFCGWCLAPCNDGEAAHSHVARCSEKPGGVDALFPNPREAFDNHWKWRKARAVFSELARLAEDEALEVRQKLRPQLQGLPLPS